MHDYIKLTAVFLLLALLSASCSTSKTNNNATYSNNRMEFTVIEIQNEMDGQTIFMEDDKGGRYTTIISPANGNWVELSIGNKISLIAEEIMESDPAQIISKDIKFLGNEDFSAIEYEKTEEETYWIHSLKKDAFGIWGQPVECFQYQTEATINKEGEWELLCEGIEYFDYLEGNYYQIKVLKKWLKNHENLMDRTPYDLELVTVISKEKDPNYINPIKTKVTTDKSIYEAGEAINLSFEIKNTSQKSYTFLPWGTPLENRFTQDCLEVKHNGVAISYSGIMVKRVPPTEKDYLTLQPHEASMGEVNLLNGYKLDTKGIYTIQFKETYKGIPSSNVIEVIVE